MFEEIICNIFRFIILSKTRTLFPVYLSRCRGRDGPEGSEDECPSSITFLSRQIQTLKKKVRRFEDQFEQEMNYKVNTPGSGTPVQSQIQDPEGCFIEQITHRNYTNCEGLKGFRLDVKLSNR